MRAFLIVVTLVLAGSSARADCVREASELRAHLTREARNARTWNLGWGIGFAAAAGGQLALVAVKVNPIGTYDAGFRDSMYVGATKASLGAASRFVLPLRVHVPAATGDVCADVAGLRAAVVETGRKERRSFWLMVLGGTAVNLAGAALLWSRHDFATAAQSFVTGAIVSPISAFTQPRRSARLARARRVEWQVAVGAGSVTLGGTF